LWRKVLAEKQAVTQVVKEFLAFKFS